MNCVADSVNSEVWKCTICGCVGDVGVAVKNTKSLRTAIMKSNESVKEFRRMMMTHACIIVSLEVQAPQGEE